MTCEFENMLRLAALGASGNIGEVPDENMDWDKVLKYAKIHKVEHLLACAIKRHDYLSCPDEIKIPLLCESRKVVFSNALHKSAILQLLRDMDEEGIHAILLKGYAIADCYEVPESRLSGDADIWIDVKDEERATLFMRRQGFSVEERWKTGHHSVCHHDLLGCVELHVSLYDELIEEVWFRNKEGAEYIIEEKLTVNSADGKYYTLGYTDHFIFLVLHMIKHFILSGLTVQMMLDVALFLRKHKAHINTDRVWEIICALSYGKLLNCILWAMVQFGGFSPDDFPGLSAEVPEPMIRVLDDLENGGWMGSVNKTNREEGWFEYNRQIMLSSMPVWKYWLYMLKWKYVTVVFPPLSSLETKYPYLKRRPYLLPCAWTHRFFVRGFRAVRKGALREAIVLNESNMNAQGKDRVKLFCDLDMISSKL